MSMFFKKVNLYIYSFIFKNKKKKEEKDENNCFWFIFNFNCKFGLLFEIRFSFSNFNYYFVLIFKLFKCSDGVDRCYECFDCGYVIEHFNRTCDPNYKAACEKVVFNDGTVSRGCARTCIEGLEASGNRIYCCTNDLCNHSSSSLSTQFYFKFLFIFGLMINLFK